MDSTNLILLACGCIGLAFSYFAVGVRILLIEKPVLIPSGGELLYEVFFVAFWLRFVSFFDTPGTQGMDLTSMMIVIGILLIVVIPTFVKSRLQLEHQANGFADASSFRNMITASAANLDIPYETRESGIWFPTLSVELLINEYRKTIRLKGVPMGNRWMLRRLVRELVRNVNEGDQESSGLAYSPIAGLWSLAWGAVSLTMAGVFLFWLG